MGSMYQKQWKACAVPRFTIGRDHHGWWVVQDRLGRVGGYFANESAARHFAAEESNFNLSDVCLAPDGVAIEFDPPINRAPARPRRSRGLLSTAKSD